MQPSSAFFPTLASEPTFVLTGDQDWAPPWAVAATLALAEDEGVPFHLFATNDDPALSGGTSYLSLGIHPNFLPNSTHGDSPEEVIEFCRTLVPGARSFRCHAFSESTHVLRALVARGFTADSNLLAFLQPELLPIVHGAGLIRLPVFLEDDVLLEWAPGLSDLGPVLRRLLTPGLKILNFHPALVALNAPSAEFYASRRDALYSGSLGPEDRHPGEGLETILRRLIAAVRDAGFAFTSFPAVVETAYETLPPDLYSWPGRDETQPGG